MPNGIIWQELLAQGTFYLLELEIPTSSLSSELRGKSVNECCRCGSDACNPNFVVQSGRSHGLLGGILANFKEKRGRNLRRRLNPFCHPPNVWGNRLIHGPPVCAEMEGSRSGFKGDRPRPMIFNDSPPHVLISSRWQRIVPETHGLEAGAAVHHI